MGNGKTVVVILRLHKRKEEYDLELPLDITANELFHALNEAFHLEEDESVPANCYLQAENPIALLKGNHTLKEYGIRNAAIIHYTR